MLKYNVLPLNDRIVVRPTEAETMAGGLHIPDAAQEIPLTATVVGVGPDVVADLLGKLIVYGQYSGVDITLGRDDFKILRESDLLGIVEVEEVVVPVYGADVIEVQP